MPALPDLALAPAAYYYCGVNGRWHFAVGALVCGLGMGVATGQLSPVAKQGWFEAQTLHFRAYSCGPTQAVARLMARLEQFHNAYALLAGSEAVKSPPVVVMAFPDSDSLRPFLPLYQGKPGNMAAFFRRGSDVNLIALSLAESGSRDLEAVYHEYAHLLLRRNQQVWPMWLNEGMADIYATFEVAGQHTVRIGQPLARYVRLLEAKPLLPLRELFAVTRRSPEYNEGERQGIFYAQSWLLTHYLMLGGNAEHRARFGQLTARLRQGQSPEEAFTGTFQRSLPAMEAELRRYLEGGRFESLLLTVRSSLYGPQAFGARRLTPVETCFRLGDHLLRIGRLEAAEAYFREAQAIAPQSPLPFEGLGLLAAERGNPQEAIQLLRTCLERGSASFLAHFVCAREQLRALATAPGTYSRLEPDAAGEIRAELKKALVLMPDFGPAHHLLGLLELVQRENLVAAEQHLQRAMHLEPENPAVLLTLAQAQLARKDTAAARRTLESLCRPYVDTRLRAQAQELLAAMGGH